jgi:hypothetical protein
MQSALLLLLGAAAGAVENALHDSRAALGDAQPCCGHCKRWLYPCPPAMHKGASPTTVSWEDFTAPLPPGAEVEIPCGTRVEVRTDLKAKIGGLRVRGELAFLDGADVELETPHVYVCGLLAAGTVKKPYESSLVSRSPQATTRPRWTRTVSITAPRPSRSSEASSSCGARRAPTLVSMRRGTQSREASSRGRRGRG